MKLFVRSEEAPLGRSRVRQRTRSSSVARERRHTRSRPSGRERSRVESARLASAKREVRRVVCVENKSMKPWRYATGGGIIEINWTA